LAELSAEGVPFYLPVELLAAVADLAVEPVAEPLGISLSALLILRCHIDNHILLILITSDIE